MNICKVQYDQILIRARGVEFSDLLTLLREKLWFPRLFDLRTSHSVNVNDRARRSRIFYIQLVHDSE